MKVIVTGGAGFVGGAILRKCTSLGWQTVDVSRSGSIRLDLGSPDFADQLARQAGEADAIVHCAASMAKGLADVAIAHVNCAGTQQVLRAASLLKVSRVVYISSVPVIGPPVRLPVDEDHPTVPPTAYHASKLFGEHLLRLANSAALRTVSLRITSPVGPGTPPGRIFSEFVRRARLGEPLVLAGQGGRRQNYVDIRDVAHAVVQCLDRQATGVFNVAGAEAISNLELARRCILAARSTSVVSFSGQPDPEEQVSWDVSLVKAHQAFGYAPAYSIEDSIAACLGAG
jgi:UDP-glucose 4-epimerase